MPYLEIDAGAAADVGFTGLGAPLAAVGKSLGVMRAELKMALLSRRDVDDPYLNARINDAYEDIATSLRFKEGKFSKSFTTVVGQPLYLLGPSVRVIDKISYLNTLTSRGGATLDKTDYEAFRNERNLTGEPRQFFDYTGVLVLWPTPTSARTFVVDGRLRPAPLVDDADCPYLPPEWHQGIVLKARYNTFSLLMEFEAAVIANNDWLDFVRRRPDQSAEDAEGMVMRSSVPRVSEQLTQKDASPARNVSTNRGRE